MFDVFLTALDERIQTPTELVDIVGSDYSQYVPAKDRRKWIYRFYDRGLLPSQEEVESLRKSALQAQEAS